MASHLGKIMRVVIISLQIIHSVQNFLERLRKGMNKTISEIGWLDAGTKVNAKVKYSRVGDHE